MMTVRNNDELGIGSMIKQVRDVTQCNVEKAKLALHDCDNDVAQAINYVLENCAKDDQWHTKNGKNKLKTAQPANANSTKESKSRKSDKFRFQRPERDAQSKNQFENKRGSRNRDRDANRRRARSDVTSDDQTNAPHPTEVNGAPVDEWDPSKVYSEWKGESIEVFNSDAVIALESQEEPKEESPRVEEAAVSQKQRTFQELRDNIFKQSAQSSSPAKPLPSKMKTYKHLTFAPGAVTGKPANMPPGKYLFGDEVVYRLLSESQKAPAKSVHEPLPPPKKTGTPSQTAMLAELQSMLSGSNVPVNSTVAVEAAQSHPSFIEAEKQMAALSEEKPAASVPYKAPNMPESLPKMTIHDPTYKQTAPSPMVTQHGYGAGKAAGVEDEVSLNDGLGLSAANTSFPPGIGNYPMAASFANSASYPSQTGGGNGPYLNEVRALQHRLMYERQHQQHHHQQPQQPHEKASNNAAQKMSATGSVNPVAQAMPHHENIGYTAPFLSQHQLFYYYQQENMSQVVGAGGPQQALGESAVSGAAQAANTTSQQSFIRANYGIPSSASNGSQASAFNEKVMSLKQQQASRSANYAIPSNDQSGPVIKSAMGNEPYGNYSNQAYMHSYGPTYSSQQGHHHHHQPQQQQQAMFMSRN